MKRIDPKTKTIITKREVSGKLFERIFLPWTAVLILSHLLSMYVAPAYLWGVHFYHFFPAWIGWILTLASLALLIPGMSEFLYERVEVFAEKIRKPFASIGQNKTFFILSLFSLPIFWIFRTRLHLLGDGYFRIRDLEQGRLHLREWLDGFIHLIIYRGTIKFIPTWTPELTYSTVSILCGGVFIFLVLKLSSLLGKTGFEKVLIFFFLISLGSMQLFFGYVESYTILQVMLLAYVLFAAMYLSGKTSILPALLSLVISIGLHISSLIFAPSFIYLLWEGRSRVGAEKVSSLSQKEETLTQRSAKKRKVHLPKKNSKAQPLLNVPAIAALIFSAVLIAIWVYRVATGLEKTGKGIFILPLKATESYSFTMFSLAHISEFLNQLFLLSPLGVSLIIFFVFFKIKFKEFEDRLTNFLIISTFFALIYLFVFNFTLGSADWDLRSSPAPFFGLLGALLFLRWGEGQSAGGRRQSADLGYSKVDQPESEEISAIGSAAGKRFKAWGLIFILVGLFHTIPWVLINAHHQRSFARYLLIQENDPHPVDESSYNLPKIARILRWAELPEEVPKMYRRAIGRNPYKAIHYYNLAHYYYEEENFDQSIVLLDTVLKLEPRYSLGNWMMGNIYVKWDEYAKALPYLEKALPYLANNMDVIYDLGQAYYWTDQPDKALACALEMIRLEPDSLEAYHLLGSTYAKLGAFENARQAWEHILNINPEDSVAIHALKELEKGIKK